MSIENATILTNSIKWPLIIDPQLQGIKWIKNRYGKRLNVIRLGKPGYLETVERSVLECSVYGAWSVECGVSKAACGESNKSSNLLSV